MWELRQLRNRLRARFIVAAGLAAVFLSLSLAGAASSLKAGLARTVITPPLGCPMGGYEDRAGGSTGVHDPLYATVMVLKS